MDTPSGFIRVARFSEIGERRSKKVVVGDDEVALWRVDGRIFAIGNVCAHQHFSALHAGILSGHTVTCPMHGWTYSLETGKATIGSGIVKTYRVIVEDDTVYCEQPAGR